MKTLLIILLTTMATAAWSQEDIFGKWKSIDDETGKAKSIVEIYKQDGKAYGKIIELLDTSADDPDPICDECNDHRKNQRIRGMEIITALKPDGDEWSKGEILDPENGKIYRCKIWVEEGLLKVRGYVSFLYRTQTWLPAEN